MRTMCPYVTVASSLGDDNDVSIGSYILVIVVQGRGSPFHLADLLCGGRKIGKEGMQVQMRTIRRKFTEHIIMDNKS